MRSRFLVIGTLVGALVLFAWQAVSHAALGLPEKGLRPFPTDSMAVAAKSIRALAPQNGMYFSAYGVFAAVEIAGDYTDKRQQFVSMMAKQLVLDVGVVLILAVLMDRLAAQSIVRTGATFGALALAFMGMIDVANGIWWNYATAWTIGNLIDQVISFFILGVTLAALQRRLGEQRIETAERAGVRARGGLPASDPGARAGR
ncbi:MAG TPA: hypothetical protein VGH98_21480 [Gemmatimonadaceae bacterium]|jgi:hypothetical protein